MQKPSKLMRTSGKILAILVFGIGLGWIFRFQLQVFFHWVVDREAITENIMRLGIWGPFVLFALLVLQVFIALVPGHALMVAGSYALGFWPSFLITLSSTVFGSQIAFVIARRWGRMAVYRLAGEGISQRWDRIADRQGSMFYFFSFVLPIFPSDLMTYVAGLGTISASRFFVANICGRLVAASFLTFVGARRFNMPAIFWVATIIGIALLFIGWRAYANKHNIQLFPPTNEQDPLRVNIQKGSN